MRLTLVLALVSISLVIHVSAQCHWACNTCTGPLQTQCLTCAVNFFIQPTDISAPYTCLPTCPAHYFGNNTTGRCQICDASCYWCDFYATNCASCATNYFWTYAAPNTCNPCNPTCNGCWQSANNCVACQPGYNYNADHTCTPTFSCHSTCLTCSGPAINQCTSCRPGRFLTATNRCNLCNAACLTCSGPNANQCTSCAPGKYLTATNTCASCHADCATCSGGASNQCLSCKSAGPKPILVGTRCYPRCTGTLLATGQTKCTTCHISCRNNNCRDATVNCVNCAVGYHRENGLCVL